MTCILVVIEDFVDTSFDIINLNYVLEIDVFNCEILDIVIDFRVDIFRILIAKVIVVISLSSFV